MDGKQIDRMSLDGLRFALAMGLKGELYKYGLKHPDKGVVDPEL